MKAGRLRRYLSMPSRFRNTVQSGPGSYHDGRFQTLDDVIQHYNQQFNLGLSPQERKELVEFLKSL